MTINQSVCGIYSTRYFKRITSCIKRKFYSFDDGYSSCVRRVKLHEGRHAMGVSGFSGDQSVPG